MLLSPHQAQAMQDEARARDLALIRKLLAGELNPSPAEDAVVVRPWD